MPPELPLAPCCTPTPSFDLVPLVLVGGALLVGHWLWRRRTQTVGNERKKMKATKNLLIVLALVAAVGFILAGRNRRAPPPPPAPAPVTVEKPRPRLVDLGAGKCIPCKAMAPILDELRRDYAKDFETIFIDVWESPDAARPYAIDLIPTQIFFDAAGRELWRHEGFLAKAEILAKWREHGVLPTPAEGEGGDVKRME